MRRHYYFEPLIMGVIGIISGMFVAAGVHLGLGVIVIAIGVTTIWMGSEKDWDDRP